jgi:hypothetical protein
MAVVRRKRTLLDQLVHFIDTEELVQLQVAY